MVLHFKIWIMVILWSVYHSLKKYGSDENITKANKAIISFIQLAFMTSLQFGKDLSSKDICGKDVYEGSTLNVTFIK